MKQKIINYFPSFCVLTLFFLNSCSNNTNSIKMKGSDTEVNLAVNLAESFTKLDPTFSIAISGGGSGLGITSLMNGQADIANSSRPLSEEEIQQFKEKNIELKTIVFAEDATAFVVHKDLPIDEISVDTLGLILSGQINNWNQIIDVDYPINIYGRQSSSGTHSFIKKKLKIEFANTAKEMTGNAQIIEGVKADKTGIGYVGAGYVAHDPNSNKKVKILKIRADSKAIAYSPLDPEAINNSLYYFQRPLYQFVLAKSWEKVRPFINFERGAHGRKLIEEHGYYTLENQQHEI
ncbi:phosphate ABC transporter substrate-binding protein [Sphingobacterium sp. DK4209]|uniref:Phosphate ABC transporter substrate-binding protein n=1 Tax=Sphingobacterium zhuxiongii TaxID=2662364 RepID=A0A5Q0QD16_9SPHI|nr:MULTISPECIES: PstS family phosphate ABC transporter substrate-binding protein [unclassified Sphingobacterium]MVZ64779.1 phosphate ABC transporter substrate-binding protein [Sphingobacterium sp. DK4209]QGA27109.1 phosphate ABC transporter substrate-binding protein [Sphingobacterium sp. dk4302]